MPAEFTATAYLYPWDVADDPSSADLISRLGVESVTIAAAYHSVRAATPRHPEHRIVDAATAALYLPIRASAWSGRRLVPSEATEWAGAHSFARARDAMSSRGIPTQAWVVATHSTAAGDHAPDLRVVNAFGDVYRYALCPSSAEVVDYASTLVSEVAAQAEGDAMIIEACGPMGVGHQSEHEKTAGADWSVVDHALLSICFCAACAHLYDEQGVDAVALRRDVLESLGTARTTIEDALGEAAGTVRELRRATALGLRAELLQAASSAGVLRVSFHATLDPWGSGPAAAVIDSGAGVHSYVVDAWAVAPQSVERVALTSAADRGSAEIAAYSTILGHPAAELDRHWSSLVAAGASELHIYHAGLASTQRLDAAARSLQAARNDVPIDSFETITTHEEHSSE